MVDAGRWEQLLDDDRVSAYPIGFVADLLDVSVQVVRRFDTNDIVSPERTSGGQRRYSRRDIGRLAQALTLAGEGIPPPGIRRILELEERLTRAEAALDHGAGRPPVRRR